MISQPLLGDFGRDPEADFAYAVKEEIARFPANYMGDVIKSWVRRAVAAEAEAKRLKDAIVEHHAQKADDRCWMDDDALYAKAGIEQIVDNHVGDKEAMLANCKRFLDNRCEFGGQWISYAELEKKLADAVRFHTNEYKNRLELEKQLEEIKAKLCFTDSRGCRIADRVEHLFDVK